LGSLGNNEEEKSLLDENENFILDFGKDEKMREDFFWL